MVRKGEIVSRGSRTHRNTGFLFCFFGAQLSSLYGRVINLRRHRRWRWRRCAFTLPTKYKKNNQRNIQRPANTASQLYTSFIFYLVFLFASSVLNFHCGSTRCWRVFMFGHLQMRPPAIEKMIHTHSPFSPKTMKKSKDLGHKLFFTFMRWSFNIFFRDALYNWPGIMRENPRCH